MTRLPVIFRTALIKCGLLAALFSAAAHAQVATLTVISAVAPAAPIFGQKVTLTASVTPPVNFGWVVFTDGGAFLGVAPVNAISVPSITTTALAAGTHSVRAAYGGSPGFARSQSAARAITVATVAGAQFRRLPPTNTGVGTTNMIVSDFKR